jgi:hypothetical protein
MNCLMNYLSISILHMRREGLVKWIDALKRSVHLGDLELLANLPKILGHCDFKVQGMLRIDKAFTREACIGLNFYSTLLAIDLSQKPLICAYLLELAIGDPMTSVISD